MNDNEERIERDQPRQTTQRVVPHVSQLQYEVKCAGCQQPALGSFQDLAAHGWSALPGAGASTWRCPGCQHGIRRSGGTRETA